MKTILKTILYSISFALFLYIGEFLNYKQCLSIGFCLGSFMSILNDILSEIKQK